LIEITLLKVLQKRKMRLSDLALETKLSANFLSDVSRNVKGVTLPTLNKLCKALKCQPGDLLKYKGEKDGI